jgi:hypothetical protein
MGIISELKEYRTALGARGFWIVMAATVLVGLALVTPYIWLSGKIGWPHTYGFHCRGRGCWIDNLIHSPKLLQGGSDYELALFALIWWMPVVVACAAVYGFLKSRNRNRNPIRPMK